VPAASFLDEVPVMMRRRENVRAPQDDHPAVDDRLGVEAARVSLGLDDVARRTADASVLVARAEGVEEPHQCPSLNDSHGAEVVDRQQRFGAVASNDGVELLGNEADRIRPRDPLERAVALPAGSAERVEQPIGRVRAGLIVVDLGAEDTARERVLARAGHSNDASILDVRHPRAGVLTVVWTAALDRSSLRHGAPVGSDLVSSMLADGFLVGDSESGVPQAHRNCPPFSRRWMTKRPAARGRGALRPASVLRYRISSRSSG
jgi:hypothetical protein